MGKWSYVVTNDPIDDFNIVYELEYNDLAVGYIKKQNGVIEVTFYHKSDRLTIPAEWLAEVLDKAIREFK